MFTCAVFKSLTFTYKNATLMCNCCICNLCGTGPGIYGFKVKDWQMACPPGWRAFWRRAAAPAAATAPAATAAARPTAARQPPFVGARSPLIYRVCHTTPKRKLLFNTLPFLFVLYSSWVFFLLKCFTSILLSKQVINSWYTISVSIKVTWTNRWIDKIKVVGIRWPEYNLPRA